MSWYQSESQRWQQSLTASALARSIRAEEYALRNRIRSILDDRRIVAQARSIYPSLACYANLSCGVWYVDELVSSGPAGAAAAAAAAAAASPVASDAAAAQPPAVRAEACYFKSTDGHTHHWQFNVSRLNAHLVQRMVRMQQQERDEPCSSTSSSSVKNPRCSGALIIDSTRKGKRFPDSFSRTLPIWCTVWNRALHHVRRSMRQRDEAQQLSVPAAGSAGAAPPIEHDLAWDTELHMPTWISSMECSMIEERLPSFVSSLLSSGLDLEPLARGLMKPLRCLWLDRTNLCPWGESCAEKELAELSFTPLLLLQCSRVEAETRGVGERRGWTYIQGAGDDEDNWLSAAGVRGFTPAMLTRYADELLAFDYDEDLVERVQEIVTEERANESASASSSSSVPQPQSSAVEFHPVRLADGFTVWLTIRTPSFATARDYFTHLAPIAAETPRIALLHLPFDDGAPKRRRRAKLTSDVEHAGKRHAEDDEQPGDQEQDDKDDLPEGEPGAEPEQSSVSAGSAPNLVTRLPIPSQSKCRHSLLAVLRPAIKFMHEHQQAGEWIVLACPDLSYLSCICAAAQLQLSRAANGPSEDSKDQEQVQCALPYSIVLITAVPDTVQSESNSALSPAASSTPVKLSPQRVAKSTIRAALTLVRSQLPQHFPARLLTKQLNQFFLSEVGQKGS